MKYTKYSKYAPAASEDIDLQELMSRLSDFLLQSGFESQYGVYEMDPNRSQEKMIEELREAILRALQEGDLLPPELMEQMLKNPELSNNQELSDIIDQIVQRMEQEGYISRPSYAASFADSRRSGWRSRAERRGPFRNHRQGPRFSRFQNSERFARLARQEQLRPPRHP